jgi:hypothetical protein
LELESNRATASGLEGGLPGLKKHNQDAATQKAARTSSGIFAVDCGITKRAAQGGEAREAPARCALRERERAPGAPS